MLGFSVSREPVRGEVAKEIRKQLFGMASNASKKDVGTVSSCTNGTTKYRLVKE